MKFEEMNIKSLVTLLTTTSKASNLEMPAILLGIMALIPGVLDESVFGVGAIAMLGALLVFRRHLKNNRDIIANRLDVEMISSTITNQEYLDAKKALNTLTIAGGQSSD